MRMIQICCYYDDVSAVLSFWRSIWLLTFQINHDDENGDYCDERRLEGLLCM